MRKIRDLFNIFQVDEDKRTQYKMIFSTIFVVTVVFIIIPFLSFSAHFWTKCKNNNMAMSQGITSDIDGLYCERILYLSETFPIKGADHKNARLHIDAGVSKALLGNELAAKGMFYKALVYEKLNHYNSLDSLSKKELRRLGNLQARVQRNGKNTKADNVWLSFIVEHFNETKIKTE